MARILVVDDELGMRQVINKILSPLGHEIIDTDEGTRAIQMAKEQSPDVVLLDIRLPDMDGPDIVAGLKKIKDNLPVIVLSGFGDVDAAVELVKLGAFDYISKPFKVNELVEIVGKALNKTNPSQYPIKRASSADVSSAAGAQTAELLTCRNNGSKKLLIAGAALGLALIAAGGYFAAVNFLGASSAEYKLPYSNASGICFDKNDVWISNWMEESIYRHSLSEDMRVAMSYKSIGTSPTGICFDGKNIWTASSLDQTISKHKNDAALSVETSFKSPGASPVGLCFDGNNIWSADYQGAKIYKHKMDAALSVESSFDVPAQNPCGIFSRKGFIYVADAKTDRIYKLSGDTLFLAAIYEIPGYGGAGKRVASIGFDGKAVWICAAGLDTVFRHKFSDLKEVKF